MRVAAAAGATGPVGYGVFGNRSALAATARGDVVDARLGAEQLPRMRWCENAHIETRAAAHDHAVRAELNGLA
ncbi:MAG: hypothetical protein KDA35_08835, partial [Hyphomonadaceae bacterium]|nr:hypothetical protein [Hyphomonadaceae bacterium]